MIEFHGYKVILKFRYDTSKETINSLVLAGFRATFFDELLFRSVDNDMVKDLSRAWKMSKSGHLARYTATLYKEVHSIEAAGNLISRVGENCELLHANIEPAMLYRDFPKR